MSRTMNFDEIENLENDKPDVNHTVISSWITEYVYPENGPIQLVTTQFECGGLNRLERKCNTLTNYLLDGEPRCWLHAIRELSDIVAELRTQ